MKSFPQEGESKTALEDILVLSLRLKETYFQSSSESTSRISYAGVSIKTFVKVPHGSLAVVTGSQ